MSAASRPRLAVDLGTTWTAAAHGDGRPVELGPQGATMPSVVARDGDGFVVGHAAERVLATRPESGIREIKRRFGDTTPVVLDGQPYTPDSLTVELLRGVAVSAGVDPGATDVVLTHPANWGEFKLDLLRNVGTQAGFASVELISEPAAAARHYAASGRLATGDTVAVYDFGGGTFDAVVMQLTADGPVQLGTPQGLERLGGIDIDQVVFSHVASTLGGSLTALDRNDPDVRRAVLALRVECTAAKEQLSVDAEATITVTAPGLSTDVRMTRDELESVLRPRIAETLQALERVV
ncbi:MAG: Hsp70 family protein, partial [Actinomycetota bacterium]|nr:Hsp70 family protein [Actinomycetota bacterium]